MRHLVTCIATLGWLAVGSSLAGAELTWNDAAGYRWAVLQMTKGTTGFTQMKPQETGVEFFNEIATDASLNGAGVALGDFDNDGWCDLYFTALHGRHRLFKNLGGWRFKDVTEGSGVEQEGQYGKGACFVDLNGDRHLDLVVTAMRERSASDGGLRCFLGNGNGRFRQTTAEAGLASNLGSHTIAAGDVDGNGTVDLYVSNLGTTDLEETKLGYHETINGKQVYSWVRYHASGRVAERVDIPIVKGRPAVPKEFADRFYVDEAGEVKELGAPDLLLLGDGKGKFTRASWTDGRFLDEDGRPLAQAPLDFGLAATIRDLNNDGAPDIYVCNDFHTPDRMWLGDGKGNFRAAPHLALRRVPFASMGIDIGDLNRDGWPDFFIVEMLARTHERRKRQTASMVPVSERIGVFANRPQATQNMLYLNQGDGTWTEISRLADVAASEWSWQPVFLDIDLDGWEDIFVTNGYARDMLDIDAAAEVRAFSVLAPKEQRKRAAEIYPVLDVPKIAFRNRGDLTFEEVGEKWGLATRGIAHGVGEADLDNDGDLDLVASMYRDHPAVYRNNSGAPRVAVRLRGAGGNWQGIGAKVTLRGGPVPVQTREMFCGGRYQSGGAPHLCFAAGDAKKLSLEVVWRSGRRSVVEAVAPNHIYEVAEPAEMAVLPEPATIDSPARAGPLFEDFTGKLGHKHHENVFEDFTRQGLLPNRLGQFGPGLAWCDVNGDGRDDLIAGSGKGGSLGILFGDPHAAFPSVRAQEFAADADFTGIGAWRSADGAMHILAGVANYEDEESKREAVRRWDMTQEFGKKTAAVPASVSSTGPIALADLDADGDLDLFVGGRLIPSRYPEPATSRLFRSEGEQFVLDDRATDAFQDLGLINGAVFSDLNGDGFPDLVLACEWGPIRIFVNDKKGALTEQTAKLGFAKMRGWWNGVTTGDLDGDGRLDIVATNWGLNSKYRASVDRPLLAYFGEFEYPGRVDVIEAYHDAQMGKLVPERSFTALVASLPFLKAKVSSFKQYGESGVKELFGDKLKAARSVSATTLDHMIFLNRGDRFEARTLPIEAQFAPGFGVSVADLDGDGAEDVVLAQNFFAVQAETPRCDAGRSLFLKGDGKGGLRAVPGQDSGILVYGDARGLAVGDFDGDRRPDVAIGQNGAATRLFRNVGAKPALRVVLRGPDGNPAGFGAQVRLQFGQRFGPAREIHGGSGFWSQDSAILLLSPGPERATAVSVRWPGGKVTTDPLSAGTETVTAAFDR